MVSLLYPILLYPTIHDDLLIYFRVSIDTSVSDLRAHTHSSGPTWLKPQYQQALSSSILLSSTNGLPRSLRSLRRRQRAQIPKSLQPSVPVSKQAFSLVSFSIPIFSLGRALFYKRLLSLPPYCSILTTLSCVDSAVHLRL